ncbi:MAG: hypothetical protein AB7H80_07575 [Candidatus Kapaibacterium sp.]
MNLAPQQPMVRYILSGVFCCLLASISFVVPVVGQERPIEATRNDLVAELNQFLANNSSTVSSTAVPFTYNGTLGSGTSDDLYLLDPIFGVNEDGCDPVSSLNIDFVFSQNHFTMRRNMNSSGTYTPDKLSNELVADLNAWLNAVWAMELQGVPEFDVYGFQCGTSDNRFYTEETTDNEAIEAIKELTGENEMLEKYYYINGDFYKGSTIFKFEKTGVTRHIRYITDRGDDTDPELQEIVRYLGNAYIEIELHDGDSDPEFTLELKIQTSPYSTGNCGVSVFDDAVACPGRSHIDYNNSDIDIIIAQVDPDTDLPPPSICEDCNNCPGCVQCNDADNSICEFGWFWNSAAAPTSGGPFDGETFDGSTYEAGYFRNPDSASKRLFRYIREHRGEWRYNDVGQLYGTSQNSQLHGVLQLGSFYLSSQGELMFVRYKSGCCDFRETSLGMIADDFDYSDEICEVTYCKGGEFFLDNKYKMLYYAAPSIGCTSCAEWPVSPPISCTNCVSLPVLCIQFCDSAETSSPTVAGVVSTNARSFSDRTALVDEAEYWGSPKISPYPWFNTNNYERGIRGKWRPSREFVFRTNAIGGTGLFPTALVTDLATPPLPIVAIADERNYNDAGTYSLNMFNWESLDKNSENSWLNPTRVVRYSQNGEPVEEIDILGIPSTAHFGYGEQVPTLVAKNASYNSVLFESFEDGKGNDWREAHSGDYSLRVDTDEWDTDSPIIGSFTVDEYSIYNNAVGDLANQSGLLIRFWAKPFFDPRDPLVYPTGGETISPVELKLEWDGNQEELLTPSTIKFIAKTGDWGLFEARVYGLTIDDLDDGQGNPKKIDIKVKSVYDVDFNGVYDKVWIDDVRMQPVKSEMVCYVYDADNLRQVAQFDDQHFGLFFQYNGRGQLIRRQRETERGIKTVEEAEYNTPLITRNYGSSAITYSIPQGNGGGSRTSDVSGAGSTFELLNVELGLEDQRLKILGTNPNELASELSKWEDVLSLPSLQNVDLPDVAKLQKLDELDKITGEIDSLERVDLGELADEAEPDIYQNSLEVAQEKRARLLSSLGLSEEEAKNILASIKNVRSNLHSAPTTDQEETKKAE